MDKIATHFCKLVVCWWDMVSCTYLMRDLIHGWWLVGQTKTWWRRKRFSDNLLHYYLIPLWLISPQAGSSSSSYLTTPWSSSSSSQDTEKLLVEKLPEATSVPLLSLRCKLFYVKKNEFSYSCHNTVNYLEKIVKIHRPWLLQDWFSLDSYSPRTLHIF